MSRQFTYYGSFASAAYFTDLFGVPAIGVSLRKLSPNTLYSGPAIRVRRSSDNTEQDINFASSSPNSGIDTTALLSFVGANDGFVTTWYDQSGNGRNAVQTTAASQPQIVSSGAMIDVNGKNSIKFDGTSDHLRINYRATSALITVESVQRINNTSGSRVSLTVIETTAGQLYLQWSFSGVFRNFYNNVITATTANTNQNIFSFYMGNSGGGFYQNGTLTASSTQISRTSATDIFIGSYTTPSNYSDVNHQEIILWQSDKQSQRSDIQTNINDYYNVF